MIPGLRAVSVATMIFAATSAWAAGQVFETVLDPAPFDASTRANVVGTGKVSATLDGAALSVTGNFSGLSSGATAAHVSMGLAMGVLGDPIGELTVPRATSGTVTGTIALTAKQLAALRARSLYIRIDSEKAPGGNLQGWLEPAGSN